MNKFIKASLMLAATALSAVAGIGPACAQTTPIDMQAPGPHIFFEVRNVTINNATRKINFNLYMSASAAYVNYVAANGVSNSMQSADVAYDIDLGTDGTDGTLFNVTNLATLGANALNANTTAVVTSVNSPMLSSATATNSLSGTSIVPYDDRFKMTVVRTTISAPLSTTPTNVASVEVTLPANVTIGTVANGAVIRLRYSASGYGTGANSSKWGDLNSPANSANVIGNSAPAVTQPLPVQLLDFSARKASDNQRVQLDWATATETGSDYFEVERSATEGGVFSSIGVRVKGAGSSTARLNYQTYDRSPAVGVNWYRLKIVDLSGKVGYSDKRSVNFDGGGVKSAEESVSLYPNPLTRVNVGGVHLQIVSVSDQSVSYTISDAGGRLVGGGSVEVSKGTASYPVEGLDALAAGTYYLKAKGATINQTLKISKNE